MIAGYVNHDPRLGCKDKADEPQPVLVCGTRRANKWSLLTTSFHCHDHKISL